jgi:hypothetical protein
MVCIDASEADEASAVHEDEDTLTGRQRAESPFPNIRTITVRLRVKVIVAENTTIRQTPTVGVKPRNGGRVGMRCCPEFHDG